MIDCPETSLDGFDQWTQAEAIDLCAKIEVICPEYGCHVALTGGLLYKKGKRKDCDLIFYRIRQCERINLDGLWDALDEVGLHQVSGSGWIHKAIYKDKSVDCLFPEQEGSEVYRKP